jgi:hypothetical protein
MVPQRESNSGQKSRSLTPRPTMTNLDLCTNIAEVIQLWLWSCIWNILVIVNAIYRGKKCSLTPNYILFGFVQIQILFLKSKVWTKAEH